MKKKILCIVLSAVLVLCLSLTAFAESLSTEAGANYDESHNNDKCCQEDGTVDTSGADNHYNEGYNDGSVDGYNEGYNDGYSEGSANAGGYTDTDVQNAVDSALEEYKNGAGQALVDDAYTSGKTDGVNEFKGSQEYEDSLEEQYQNGVDSGYQSGYDQAYDDAAEAMYDKGVADGYADFRNTEEYHNSLTASADGAYAQGYTEGYNDGHDTGVEKASEGAYDHSRVVSLILILIAVVILSFVITTIQLSKKKAIRGNLL